MPLHEIVFLETKPETEWVRGRALQKVSPTYRHGLAQRRIATALGAWAESRDCGRVATEWRFRVTPPGQVTRPLVPDVGYASYEVLPKSARDSEVGVPQIAPTVAVEIRSPDDRQDDVDDKIQTYLIAGTEAVIVVDPVEKTAAIHDARGTHTIARDGTLRHAALPDFALPIAGLFADA